MLISQRPAAVGKVTYKEVADRVAKLATLGVPVSGIMEEVQSGGLLMMIDTTDKAVWQDDGTPGDYYFTAWGKQMNAYLAFAVLDDQSKTPLIRMVVLATNAFPSASAAATNAAVFNALENLPSVAAAINGALSGVCPTS